ncbi:hypothetical protein I79_022692 [Cricetulus griseus]|uniref:Uncharacterized protein n=1 Tax=Cricetulus griseus TaxID=10029 RepID=G3IG15_CRIGR|nr:hypothetical protein I79_022692 [Cricetulus griseus]
MRKIHQEWPTWSLPLGAVIMRLDSSTLARQHPWNLCLMHTPMRPLYSRELMGDCDHFWGQMAFHDLTEEMWRAKSMLRPSSSSNPLILQQLALKSNTS